MLTKAASIVGKDGATLRLASLGVEEEDIAGLDVILHESMAGEVEGTHGHLAEVPAGWGNSRSEVSQSSYHAITDSQE